MRASRARVTSVAKSLTEFPPTRPSWPSSGGGRRRLRLRLGPGIGRLGLCFRCLNGRGRAAAPRSRAPFACRLGAVVGSLVLGLAAERGVRNVDPRADGSLCGLIRVSGAVVRAGCGSRGRLPAAPASPRAAASALARSCLGTLLRLALAHGLGLLDFVLLLGRNRLRLSLLRRLGALAAGSSGRLLRQAFGGDRRELLRGLGADEACVDRPVHDALDARLDLLADELRGVADADRVAVDLAHPGAGIGEVGLHDSGAGMGKVDGYAVCVGDAAKLVGKKVKARVERVMDGTIYASLVGAEAPKELAPITAEGLAEKPTRAAGRKGAEPAEKAEPEPVSAEEEDEVEETEAEAESEVEPEEAAESVPRKRTRRGSRGGRRRRKPAAAAASGSDNGTGDADEAAEAAAGPRIHVPDPSLDSEAEDEASDNGAQPARKRRSRSRRRSPATTVGATEAKAETPDPEPQAESGPPAEGEAPKRKKTRRGSRGGRRRKKAATGATAETPSDS